MQGIREKDIEKERTERDTSKWGLLGSKAAMKTLDRTHQHYTYKIILLVVIIKVVGMVVGTKRTMFNLRAVAAMLPYGDHLWTQLPKHHPKSTTKLASV